MADTWDYLCGQAYFVVPQTGVTTNHVEAMWPRKQRLDRRLSDRIYVVSTV